jgi:hypothetical protein
VESVVSVDDLHARVNKDRPEFKHVSGLQAGNEPAHVTLVNRAVVFVRTEEAVIVSSHDCLHKFPFVWLDYFLFFSSLT